MLAEAKESRITNEDITRMIAEMDEGWKELNNILRSCLTIRMDLINISQYLDELPTC
ncbi:hypothetical protein ACFPES_31850 [Paenibacillus sp. GCM10023248]|uniref:hypothetical protein n=1 Tax=unclassified Paenibacillus TaxID=185978 RepID=UPI002379C2A2|nr:hypothetical protein [Paenibacillus sp. MAHUQ-63]MDD9271638.1 hypothetical protein [Paenibacillus sp. MAHUQ-63]